MMLAGAASFGGAFMAPMRRGTAPPIISAMVAKNTKIRMVRRTLRSAPRQWHATRANSLIDACGAGGIRQADE